MNKKAFRIVATVFAVFVVLGTLLMAACKNKDKNKEPEVTTALQSIVLDLSNVRTEYYIGEEFSADGLVVKAKFQKSDGSAPYEETLNSTDYTVDSSKYNKAAVGEYEIRVSYTYEQTTKSILFGVSVAAVSYDGLEVTLAENVADTYHLSAEAATVEIDTSKITVKETDVNGNVIDTAISGYTVELYRGKEEITLTDGKASVGEGAYQIWVSKASDKVADYVRTCFVTVYVLDDVKTLVWNSEAEGTVATQEEGDDVITETLKFVVTYESGATKVVGADKVTMAALDTKTVGEGKTVTATYSELNAKSENKTTSEATVTYTVTAKPEEGPKPQTVEINASDLTAGDIKEETEIASGIFVMATSDKAVTVDANSKTADGLTFTNRIKLNGAGSTASRSIKVVATGAGKVTVYAITGSSSDLERTLGLYGEDGTLVEGSMTDGIPNAVTKLEFTVAAAGTYYIWGAKAVNLYYIKLETVPAAAEPVEVEINVSDLTAGDIKEETEIASGISVMATSDKAVTVDANSKSADGLTFTNRIKLNGAGSTASRSIKIVATGAGKVTVYAITGSSSDLERTLGLYGEDGTLVEGSMTEGIPNAVTKLEFTIPAAGTYYIWGAKAVNLYYIKLETSSAAPVEKEPVKVSLNASDLTAGDIKEETEIASGIFVMATSDKAVTVDANSKSADGLTFTNRIKLNGAGSTASRSIKIVATGAGKVVVYAITGSSSDLERTLGLYGEDGTLVEGSMSDGIPNAVTKIEFTITEAGTYYIWGAKAVNIYYIETEF